MLTLQKYKSILGQAAEDMSDAEIETLRDLQYGFATIAFDIWCSKGRNVVEKVII